MNRVPTRRGTADTPGGDPAVTPREAQVLACAADGLGCKATGQRLGISEYTVRKHRASLLRKLGLRNATELTAHALARTGAGAGNPRPGRTPRPTWRFSRPGNDRSPC